MYKEVQTGFFFLLNNSGHLLLAFYTYHLKKKPANDSTINYSLYLCSGVG